MKKIKPYNTTRIKSRNALSNISYNRNKQEDLFGRNFVFDVFTLIHKSVSVETKNLQCKK